MATMRAHQLANIPQASLNVNGTVLAQRAEALVHFSANGPRSGTTFLSFGRISDGVMSNAASPGI